LTRLDDLSQKISDNENEIEALYAGATGLDIAGLSESERSALEEETLIEQAEEALAEGERTARKVSLASTPIGRLILERHEITEQIRNALDYGLDDELDRD
jgi:hypothetical protein